MGSPDLPRREAPAPLRVSTIAATAGEPFEVELPEHAAAGYTWRLEPVPDDVELLDAPFSPPPPGPLGSPGQRRFVLRAARPGLFELRFLQARAWEADAPLERVIEVRVRPSEASETPA